AAGVAFTFADPRISESSGLASSSAPGIVFTHNDSGDEARFFAVGDDGRTRTTYDLPDVRARDWEDMARGPDEQGRSSLWLGDIGDNNALRDQGILVHRVAEPEPTEREQVTTEPPTSFRLRYPDGPGDAEGLMVHPTTGRLYVVSKPLAGAARVYAAPQPLDPDGPNLLEQVASVTFSTTGTPGGPGIGSFAQVLVTAADIAPDGSRIALRTYTDLYEWPLEGEDVGAALAGEPVVTPLPETRQGEGLTYTADSAAVLVSTEGEGTPVHRVPSGRVERPAEPSAEPSRVDRVADPPSRWPLVIGGGALLAVLLVVRGTVRRRRYRSR
ncbi:MAG: hypothetical protein LH469_14470, partial [Frankiaceae bacterium]|nr:hypothetical protein [Frankiaceae bacterium]